MSTLVPESFTLASCRGLQRETGVETIECKAEELESMSKTIGKPWELFQL